jgi:hypothetical protein
MGGTTERGIEVKFTIVHPVTGDRAYADDHEGAKQAQRTLRNEAVDQGVSPRITAQIFRTPREEQD